MYWNDKKSSLRGTATRKHYGYGDKINPVDVSAQRKKDLMESGYISEQNPIQPEAKKPVKRGRPPKAVKTEEKPE